VIVVVIVAAAVEVVVVVVVAAAVVVAIAVVAAAVEVVVVIVAAVKVAVVVVAMAVLVVYSSSSSSSSSVAVCAKSQEDARPVRCLKSGNVSSHNQSPAERYVNLKRHVHKPHITTGCKGLCLPGPEIRVVKVRLLSRLGRILTFILVLLFCLPPGLPSRACRPGFSTSNFVPICRAVR